MAGASLLALMDDIASVLDDVALLTKVAAKKTAGVLGDDLALNAQQVSDVRADRELPVVWAVAKGSFRNKLILVPAALAISALTPWAVMPLLMVGGAYLCLEGVEKVVHGLRHGRDRGTPAVPAEPVEPASPDAPAAVPADPAALEAERVRGAVRTDFVLSAEIVTIALGTVAEAAFATRVAVLSGIAVLMTVGVYGFVAGIVKMDDAGLALAWTPGRGAPGRAVRALGVGLLALAPLVMRALAVVGTAAMFLVGGGIVTHGVPVLHHLRQEWAARVADVPLAGPLLEVLAPSLADLAAGIGVGAVALGLATAAKTVRDALRRRA